MNEKVINLEDMRIRILKERPKWDRNRKECRHINLTFNDDGQIITCDDCHKQIQPYWAFHMLAERFDDSMKRLNRKEADIKVLTEKTVHLIAARRVEAAWRQRSMVPTCPHCERGILPEDSFGSSLMSRSIELRIREIEREKKASASNRKIDEMNGYAE